MVKTTLVAFFALIASVAVAEPSSPSNVTDAHTHASRAATWYTPPQKFQWQWQIDGTITRVPRDVYPDGKQADMLLYDVDIETSAAKIAEIKTWGGAKVVCYFEAGTWVKTRPWASKYSGAAGATGKTVSGAIGFPYEAPYTNELWVNPSDPSVRSVMKDVILPFAKARGCDMVEPDNVQGFERDSYCTGFEAKTGANCGSCKAGSPANKNFYIDKKCDADYKAWLDFNKFLADSAHALGMGIALKNNHHQAAELVKYHDFVLAEQCTSFGSSYSNGTTIGASLLGSKAKDCVGFVPFLKAGKGVALTAYTGTIAKACTDAAPYLPFGGLNTILKKTSLKSTRKACCGAVPCGVGSVGATTPKPLAR